MADTFGLLELPVPLAGEGEVAGDPFLTVLGATLQAVLNSRIGAAWHELCPDKRVVETVRTWDPALNPYSDKELPALFVWRASIDGTDWLAQDYYLANSTIHVLWIPPVVTQDKRGARSGIPTAIHSTVNLTVERWGQDSSYVDPTDPNPQNGGSLMWGLFGIYSMDLGKGAPHVLTIANIDDFRAPIKRPGYLMQISVKERIGDDLASRYALIDGVEGTTYLDDLARNPFVFKLRANYVLANTGPAAGGTSVIILGTGITDGCTVLFGTDEATDVSVSDDGTTVACTTPAHAAGAVDVTITNLSEQTATITAGYTFT